MRDVLTRIGSREREQHYYLRPEHRCYYWGEYTPWAYTRGQNAGYSDANQLVADLKISRECWGLAQEWERKCAAIERVSGFFARAWRWSELASNTLLVPVPASRRRDDPLYDDRMERVLTRIQQLIGLPLQCAPILSSDGSLESSHSAALRPTLRSLLPTIQVDESAAPQEPPKRVFLFDDVLTTGAHFIASAAHIQNLYPQARIVGNFVARSRRPEPDE